MSLPLPFSLSPRENAGSDQPAGTSRVTSVPPTPDQQAERPTASGRWPRANGRREPSIRWSSPDEDVALGERRSGDVNRRERRSSPERRPGVRHQLVARTASAAQALRQDGPPRRPRASMETAEPHLGAGRGRSRCNARELRHDGAPALVAPSHRVAEARHAPYPAASADGHGRRWTRRTGGPTGARASARQRRKDVGQRILGVRATVAILSNDVDAPSRPARRPEQSAATSSRPHAGRLWGRPERAMQRTATSRPRFGRDSTEAFGPEVTDRDRPEPTNRRGAVLEKVTQAHGSSELREAATPRAATDSSVEEGPEADLAEGSPTARRRAAGMARSEANGKRARTAVTRHGCRRGGSSEG